MYHIKAVKITSEYTLQLCFSNQEWRVINLKPFLWGEVFTPLLDIVLFNQVRIDEEAETIVWPNGADFAPEFLYQASKPAESSVV